MSIKVNKVGIYHAAIPDEPGGLAGKLTALAQAGANLEFVVARRAPERAGLGVVFVAPVKPGKQARAAKAAGFESNDSPALRLVVPNAKGGGAKLTNALAGAGINLRGLSAAALGRQAVVYLRFDSPADAAKAVKVLKKAK